ncbi:MAG: hypothetical protein ACR2RB_03950 [Gammaproteobacteria bacterium]
MQRFAQNLIEIRRTLAASSLLVNGDALDSTLGIGVTTIGPEARLTVDKVITSADELLCKAKTRRAQRGDRSLGRSSQLFSDRLIRIGVLTQFSAQFVFVPPSGFLYALGEPAPNLG